MTHKWHGTGRLARVHGDDVAPGESFEATDAELRAFGEVIETVAKTPEDTGEPPDEINCASENCSRSVSEEGDYCWQHPLDGD